MRRNMITLALAMTCWCDAAQAQIGTYVPPTINRRPTVSPYLNMFRNSPGMNYYGAVRPQVEMARQLDMLQQQYATPSLLPPLLGLPDQTGLLPPTTGHPVMFMNTSHFYGGRLGSPGSASPPIAGGAGNPLGRANPSTVRPILVTGSNNSD